MDEMAELIRIYEGHASKLSYWLAKSVSGKNDMEDEMVKAYANVSDKLIDLYERKAEQDKRLYGFTDEELCRSVLRRAKAIMEPYGGSKEEFETLSAG